MEVWIGIKGYEGKYQVSSIGRIRSVKRKNRLQTKVRATPLRSGYPFCILFNNGIRKQFNVHRLVADAFINKVKEQNEVNHKNGIKTDNRVENLEWVTHQENMIHRCRVLGKGRGSRNGLAKLKEEDIPVIRQKLSDGEFHRDIAKEYGVTKSVITSINLKETWTHI